MWCLTQYPPPSTTSTTDGETWVWERELKLVEKMLDLDPRNFHGWNCRRAIVEHLALSILSSHSSATATTTASFPALLSHPCVLESDGLKSKLLALAEKELRYALKKIESNFSNFSAWHQRSKLLPHLWTAKGLGTEQRDAEIDAELELVKQAMYTDPSDQSVWFYHRWLVELLSPSHTQQEQGEPTSARQIKVLEEEVGVIEELFELEPDSKWCAISLAHYHTLLAGLYGVDVEKGERARRGRKSCWNS
ncbi:related to Rab geranylgeranyltransferase alpha subunit [Ustilago trichophora]|uniref:Geranylgeranyl transferase type-2 subunit alpha n=1 Tax=Ustilago trichophora TaxID=86804 RepID=A0A5C3E6R1_9BASI|nr:related to Rab geranylgeranyltransferase alpha subunit [Ustilago trichophora]